MDSNDDLVAIRDNVLREIESYYRFNNIECYAFRIAALVRMTFFVMVSCFFFVIRLFDYIIHNEK